MASNDPSEQDLRQREADLKKRELALRLREIEAGLARVDEDRRQTATPAPLKRPNKMRRWWRMTVTGLQFFAVVVAVLVAVRVAFWLASVLMVLSISWLIYKLFFESSFRGDNRDD